MTRIGTPKNIQTTEISQTERSMGESDPQNHKTRPGWNSAESEMRGLGRANKGVAEKMKGYTALSCVLNNVG